MSTPLVSIVIPAYNSAHRIHIPLAALAAQEGVRGQFEVIVVDNNSTDQTGRAVESDSATELLKSAGVECRVVSEPNTGLTFARICGVRESRGELVCFLDDDNFPAIAYVSEGIKAFQDASVGLLVSRVFPRYLSASPGPSITRREHLLAINHKLGDRKICFGAKGSLAPTIGAGMWVRRSAFLAAVPWRNPALLLTDRLGNHLASGGDIELGFLIGKEGYERVYCPNLSLQHIIPHNRLEFNYFCRLITGVVRSTLTLEAKYLGRTHCTRFAAVCGLLLAVLAVPVFVAKPDGIRDWLFACVSRWAKCLGPYAW